MNRIDSFKGPFRYLSNFYPCVVEFEGMRFPSVEHAYQAAKTTDFPSRLWFTEPVMTAGEAKRRGRNIKLRPDWEETKIDVMRYLLRQKFQRPDLKSVLLATEDFELVEGNTWGDKFWGVCRGEGQNWLGKLLMEIREELRIADGTR